MNRRALDFGRGHIDAPAQQRPPAEPDGGALRFGERRQIGCGSRPHAHTFQFNPRQQEIVAEAGRLKFDALVAQSRRGRAQDVASHEGRV